MVYFGSDECKAYQIANICAEWFPKCSTHEKNDINIALYHLSCQAYCTKIWEVCTDIYSMAVEVGQGTKIQSCGGTENNYGRGDDPDRFNDEMDSIVDAYSHYPESYINQPLYPIEYSQFTINDEVINVPCFMPKYYKDNAKVNICIFFFHSKIINSIK